jgi:hypothetical protein
MAPERARSAPVATRRKPCESPSPFAKREGHRPFALDEVRPYQNFTPTVPMMMRGAPGTARTKLLPLKSTSVNASLK